MNPLIQVLIVDDEPLGRETLAALLSPLGYQLHFAATGAEALNLAKALPPDLILLDLNVPRQPGDQVLKRIRSSFRMGRIPVIVMSSSESPADRERLMKLGATDFFRKSASLGDFMKLGPLLRTFCGGTQGS